MKQSKLITESALSTLGVVVYVSAVAWLMTAGDNFSGNFPSNFVGPMLFLMLFVLSASIVGSLIFGRPVYLFLCGSKKEAVKLLFYTIAWLFSITMLGFIIFCFYIAKYAS